MWASDPEKTLQILFAYPESQVRRDAENALSDYPRIIREVRQYFSKVPCKNPPKVDARFYHNLMLAGIAMGNLPNTHEDLSFFWKVHTAEDIASDACAVAMTKGTLSELGRAMAQIRKREGLKEDGLVARLGTNGLSEAQCQARRLVRKSGGHGLCCGLGKVRRGPNRIHLRERQNAI